MTRRYRPIDASKLRTYSAQRRQHKASVSKMASLPPPRASAADLIHSFPGFLGAGAFRRVVQSIIAARLADRPVVAAVGAHVIKVGCSPILIDLIERGVLTAIACNGAFAIHDMELASLGETSEEVSDTIKDGSFGMVAETLSFFEKASVVAGQASLGLGEAIGKLLIDQNPPHLAASVFAAAYRKGIPICVHIAVGTDTVHVAPRLDGAALGAASFRDFRLICDVVSDLGAGNPGGPGGVWLNIGSAVLMPEVFLKAVSLARNLGANLDAMVTANFDMLRHYRPQQNVVSRPVTSGQGFDISGHHEIMLPLLRQAILEGLIESQGSASFLHDRKS